jgi:FkbM family methyltransferase
MSAISTLARTAIALGVPDAILKRGAPLRGTAYLARAALSARINSRRPFQIVNVGACDGVLFDDVTPWLHRIAHSRAVLVEPIPYNQTRLRHHYPDASRFVIEPVAVTREAGTITVKTFDEHAIETGALPLEFVGCSSITETNLMSGVDVWGRDDQNFSRFKEYIHQIEVKSDTLANILTRNKIDYIDAFLVDCEGADWIVFDQLDLARYRPGLVKIEIGALLAEEIGKVVLKLQQGRYDVGFYAEDIWAFAT